MTTPTKPPPTDTGACGQLLGYSRHKARREKQCKPCSAAANAHRRAARLARPVLAARLPSTFGRYAGRSVLHAFAGARDVSQCVECFGWRDDVRHL